MCTGRKTGSAGFFRESDLNRANLEAYYIICISFLLSSAIIIPLLPVSQTSFFLLLCILLPQY